MNRNIYQYTLNIDQITILTLGGAFLFSKMDSSTGYKDEYTIPELAVQYSF